MSRTTRPQPKRPHAVDLDGYQEASFDDYYYDFSAIWKRDFQERSAFDLWLHVVDHASRVARAIRKQQPAAVIDDIADTTVWMLSFIALCHMSENRIDRFFKLHATPTEIIWSKYPAICPSCFDFWLAGAALHTHNPETLSEDNETIQRLVIEKARNHERAEYCSCMTRTANFRAEHEYIARNRASFDRFRVLFARKLRAQGKQPTGIDELQRMFKDLYANYHEILTLDTMAFHLLEEIGETTEALKDMYTYDDSREPYTDRLADARRARLCDEIADVFSWLFTLALKIDATYVRHAREYWASISPGRAMSASGESLTFADIIWSKYGQTENGGNWERLRCPGCRAAPCECARDLKIAWGKEKPTVAPSDDTGQEGQEEPDSDLIFISYSRKDAIWLDRLETMLKPLERAKSITTWSDRDIQSGRLWSSEIQSALDRARMAILLVSDNFLASDFIAENELPPLLERGAAGGLQIVWIPISSCMYRETRIANYQAAADPKKPLDGLSEAEWKTVLMEICTEINLLWTTAPSSTG